MKLGSTAKARAISVRPVIAPPGECKSDWDTFALLAEAMGYDDEYFKRSEEEMLQIVLDHPTPAVAALPDSARQVLQDGGSISIPIPDHLQVGTPSGKFRLVNEDMAEPMPRYTESYGGNYPLRLVASPSAWSLNCEFRDNDFLMDKRGAQKLIMHTQDAAARNIKNGQQVKAWNDLSSVIFEAVVTDAIAPGNVVSEGIFRRDTTAGGRSFNALTSQRLSDLGEGTTMNDNRVEVCGL